uniref:ATP-dependent DNA helicase n=1 Tax=Amphimedon queenslandica TaxID=400682 RepID=A0A1X7UTX0_AMPQE
MHGLNSKQREMVMYNRDWCKRAVVALCNNAHIEPYPVFLSGPGGVGKSHVIRLSQSDTMKLLRLSGEMEPTDVPVLLTAATGVATFNIGGMTLRSAFVLDCGQLGYQQLSSDKVNTLRTRLSKLKLLIIDEVSMVGTNFLFILHKRLKQIMNLPDSRIFGDVFILAFRDLCQLPPVLQSPLISTIADGSLASLHGSGFLWKDVFKMLVLTEII